MNSNKSIKEIKKEKRRKGIKNSLKASLYVFLILFILQFFLVKFIGPANVTVPGAAAKKLKIVPWEIVFNHIPFILLASCGGACFTFIVSVEYFIRKEK